MAKDDPFTMELARRMAAPQRHRLLQGYPMVPLLRPASDDLSVLRGLDGSTQRTSGRAEAPPHLTLDPTRPLLIGVIPHTQCCPKVRACGFCTFGQDPYQRGILEHTVARVCADIDGLAERWPSLCQRRVEAVYFGGGTANLTPAKQLRALAQVLQRRFDLRQAEVTLEGVPSLFRSLLFGPFDALLEMPARHRRVSMGVQSFDREQIARMGRGRFGDAATVSRVVAQAHRAGATASVDLLFNLPHQRRAQMVEDLRVAAGLGVDQICIYHLVLHAEQGTPWAEDPALLAALPGLDEAAENWLALREHLLAEGFVQTSLTNFERAAVHGTPRRFIYEECSFTPQRYDALGFGPLSISTFTNLAERRALKLLRSRAEVPTNTAGRYGREDLYFPYEEEDLKLLFLTRSLPRLQVERAVYQGLFGADLAEDFGGALAALRAAGVVTVDEAALRLTPRGMFFADSVAGLLAWRRAAALRPAAWGRHTANLLRDEDDAHMG